MSFELYYPTTRQQVTPGCPRMDVNGSLRIHRADLAKVRINGEVTLMVDKATKRIALRAPRNEDVREPSTPARCAKNGATVRIAIRGALSSIGIESRQVAGPLDLMCKLDDGLLILSFGGKPKK